MSKMADLTHAILIEGGSYERRVYEALELLKGFFSDDPAAAAKIDGGIFEDLFFLEPEEGKDILVDQVEDLIELFKQKPFASTGKACIITRGERINVPAQNKMLKLLEEPAGRDVIVILTENGQKLLPTIRSRLMRIWLGYTEPDMAVPTEDMRKLVAALVYGKGTLAEANSILSGYDGSRDEAGAFLSSFGLLLRNFSVGRISKDLISDGEGSGWIADSAGRIEQEHADRMCEGVFLAEKAQTDLERGFRAKYVLRRMALAMRTKACN